MLIVAALGGNALLRRHESLDAEVAQRNVKVAASALAEIAQDHQLVVTHGNGPQIGLLALQSEAFHDVRTYPLDVLGAESEGMIGYLLERELGNVLGSVPVASLITQTVVDALDPAFQKPSKPIGPVYDVDRAQALAASAVGPSRRTGTTGAGSLHHRLPVRSWSFRPFSCCSNTASWSCVPAVVAFLSSSIRPAPVTVSKQ